MKALIFVILFVPTIFCKSFRFMNLRFKGLSLTNSVIVNGDLVIFGNPFGYDCSPNTITQTPVVGTTNCAGNTNVVDSAVDLYWSVTNTTANASSSVRT